MKNTLFLPSQLTLIDYSQVATYYTQVWMVSSSLSFKVSTATDSLFTVSQVYFFIFFIFFGFLCFCFTCCIDSHGLYFWTLTGRGSKIAAPQRRFSSSTKGWPTEYRSNIILGKQWSSTRLTSTACSMLPSTAGKTIIINIVCIHLTLGSTDNNNHHHNNNDNKFHIKQSQRSEFSQLRFSDQDTQCAQDMQQVYLGTYSVQRTTQVLLHHKDPAWAMDSSGYNAPNLPGTNAQVTE